LTPQLLERIARHLGPGRVARLKVVQGPPRGLAEEQAPPPVPPPRPVDPRRLAQSLRAVCEMPQGPLRESLLRLGRTLAGA
ncbi:MAG: hypothetical protein NZ523_12340, partial [Elioraea sp.]|nr:hypothetical protein [Elioraea sp.]